MPDYSNFSAEQFSQDDYFRQWTLYPTAESDHFWTAYIQNNPLQKETLVQAKAQIIAFEELFGDSLKEREINDAIELLQLKAGLQNQPRQLSISFFAKLAAASVFLISLAYYFLHTPALDSSTIAQKEEWIDQYNAASSPQTIVLSDGSEVVLSQNSSIRYLSTYQSSPTRPVHLTGEAFFDIAKDSLHPFLVYAGPTVTRVVGTSFRVQSMDNAVEVSVASGQVAVHRLQDFETHQYINVHAIPGVILSPQDKAIFEATQQTFQTSRVTKKEDVIIARTHYETEFTNIPVSQILDSLSTTYQIPIHYDQKTLEKCRVTTMFKDEPFLQKIRLVCLAIDAEYHIQNGAVHLGPSSCN